MRNQSLLLFYFSNLLFLRIRRNHRPNSGSIIGVLRNSNLYIPQALEVFDDLAALEEFGQATDEDIILDAGVPGGQDSGLADVLDDHMDDTSRDVLGLGLGIRLAEVGRSHVQVQAGELFLGQIADPQVDLCHITFPGQRDDLMDVPGIQYDRGQSADGSATEADTT